MREKNITKTNVRNFTDIAPYKRHEKYDIVPKCLNALIC
jgi:hypothetical protein